MVHVLGQDHDYQGDWGYGMGTCHDAALQWERNIAFLPIRIISLGYDRHTHHFLFEML